MRRCFIRTFPIPARKGSEHFSFLYKNSGKEWCENLPPPLKSRRTRFFEFPNCRSQAECAYCVLASQADTLLYFGQPASHPTNNQIAPLPFRNDCRSCFAVCGWPAANVPPQPRLPKHHIAIVIVNAASAAPKLTSVAPHAPSPPLLRSHQTHNRACILGQDRPSSRPPYHAIYS